MNEQEYEEMLGIPITTTSVKVKKRKKKRQDVKGLLLKKINDGLEKENQADDTLENNFFNQSALNGEELNETVSLNPMEIEDNGLIVSEAENNLPVLLEDGAVQEGKLTTTAIKKVKRKRIGVIGVEVAVICLLIATILMTNAFIPQSGINTFFASIFNNTESVDNRTYKDFNLKVKDDNVKVENGVLTFGKSSSVYPLCDGVVSNLVKEESGLYSMEITYNDNFKCKIDNLSYAYFEKGESVFSKIPVGFSDGVASMCFLDGDNGIITGYSMDGLNLIWAV